MHVPMILAPIPHMQIPSSCTVAIPCGLASLNDCICIIIILLSKSLTGNLRRDLLTLRSVSVLSLVAGVGISLDCRRGHCRSSSISETQEWTIRMKGVEIRLVVRICRIVELFGARHESSSRHHRK